MKKKKMLIIAILLATLALLLVPARVHYEDGGSIGYKAVLYEVVKLHELGSNNDTAPYVEGIEIKVLGMTAYRNTNK